MKTITSTENPLFKSLKELTTPKGRRGQGLFLAEGPHLVEEAVRSGTQIAYAVVSDEAAGKYAELAQRCEAAGAELIAVPGKLFKALSDAETPQGILAAVGQTYGQLDVETLFAGRLTLVMERVQDPGNLGTMLRTALAVGADFAVLADNCADPYSQKAVRSSQGACMHLKLIRAETAVKALSALNGAGWHTACGHLRGTDFFQRLRHEKVAIVIGNEAAGVSEEAAAQCAALYRLPMPGAAESLNAAVAAGVMLYDLMREQNQV